MYYCSKPEMTSRRERRVAQEQHVDSLYLRKAYVLSINLKV